MSTFNDCLLIIRKSWQYQLLSNMIAEDPYVVSQKSESILKKSLSSGILYLQFQKQINGETVRTFEGSFNFSDLPEDVQRNFESIENLSCAIENKEDCSYCFDEGKIKFTVAKVLPNGKKCVYNLGQIKLQSCRSDEEQANGHALLRRIKELENRLECEKLKFEEREAEIEAEVIRKLLAEKGKNEFRLKIGFCFNFLALLVILICVSIRVPNHTMPIDNTPKEHKKKEQNRNWKMFIKYVRSLNESKATALQQVDFGKIEKINLNDIDIGVEGGRLLSRVEFSNFRVFNLANCKIGDQGIAYISQAKWPELQWLNIASNNISEVGAQHLLKANWPKLKNLFLYNNSISVGTEINIRLKLNIK